MQNRYLLYIDILGFSELVRGAPARVQDLYRIIDSLNVHRHHAFKTIVFSDTILVYSKDSLLQGNRDHEYVVMYSCEFAQDLMYRFVGTEFAFRAVLKFGEFDHYRLTRTECFYGRSLVDAYLMEKSVKCVGLFIDEPSQRYNRIFPVCRHSDDLSYVYLNQATQRTYEYIAEALPIFEPQIYESADNASAFVRDAQWLKETYERANKHPSPDVRLKYLTAWNYQLQRYPKLLYPLLQSGFDLRTVSPRVEWPLPA